MRIKDSSCEASCATMSNQQVLNGDITDHCDVNKVLNNDGVNDLSKSSKPASPSNHHLSEGGIVKGPKKRIRDAFSDHCSSFSPDNENYSQSASSGGRLKFFKDGKFILELSHKKEGDKTCWIPVTKKPCWPPITTPRPGSLTSLSASDDSSSVLSLPWQREHRWKQSSPRQHLNVNIEFRFHKTMCLKYLDKKKKSLYLRRKPFECVDNILSNNCSTRKNCKDDLASIIQGLWERLAMKSEPEIVSPRKRILKELEKVSLDESSKRQKGPPGRVVSAYSIAALLEENDDTVLRTLLRSPSTSPDSIVSRSPGLLGPLPRDSSTTPPIPYSSAGIGFPSPYRVPFQSWHSHYPLPSPPVPLPLYPGQPFLGSRYIHPSRVLPEPFPDAPLNLSKNAG